MTDFERGAEAMQRACARVADNGLLNVTIAAAIRALRLPAQPPGSESREARLGRENTRHVVLVEQLSDALLQFVCTNCDTPFVANGPVLRVESRGCDECAPTRGALMDALKLRRPASDSVPNRQPDARPEEKK